jgi:hypothetical protein
MSEQLTAWAAADRKSGESFSKAWQTHFRARGKAGIERATEIEESARLAEVQDKREEELMALPNVVGVAPSLKITGGKPTGKWSLTCLVEKKLAKGKLAAKETVPAEVDGVPTDVVEVGKIEALVFNAKVRPALPGYSIGHYNITAGTFGCLVRDIRRCCCKLEKDCGCSPTQQECPGDYLILSNNHILAATNAGKPGDSILQPGPIDGGLYPSDEVAKLDRFEEIVFSRSGYNLVDAAVARPTHSRNVTPSILGVLIPRSVDQAFVGDLVIKAGRTTQITQGRVLSVNATVAVGFALGTALFRHQIITTAMAAGGDSGSLLMGRELNAVGLLFAGSPIITIHNHIGDVEAALGVRPLTAPRSG